MIKFSADEMMAISTTRKMEQMNNNMELASLYLNLAYFYIKESAEKGGTRCGIYVPARVHKTVIDSLALCGYKISKLEHRYNWFIVSWEE